MKLFCGEIIPYLKTVPSIGYATYCDKKEISRIRYHELFSIIGTVYGNGDGETTFNVPDYPGNYILVKNYEKK